MNQLMAIRLKLLDLLEGAGLEARAVGWTLESEGREKMKTLHVIAEHDHFPKSALLGVNP